MSSVALACRFAHADRLRDIPDNLIAS